MPWFYVENVRDYDSGHNRLYIFAKRKKIAGRRYHGSKWDGEARQEAQQLAQTYPSLEQRIRYAQQEKKAVGVKVIVTKLSVNEYHKLKQRMLLHGYQQGEVQRQLTSSLLTRTRRKELIDRIMEDQTTEQRLNEGLYMKSKKMGFPVYLVGDVRESLERVMQIKKLKQKDNLCRK